MRPMMLHRMAGMGIAPAGPAGMPVWNNWTLKWIDPITWLPLIPQPAPAAPSGTPSLAPLSAVYPQAPAAAPVLAPAPAPQPVYLVTAPAGSVAALAPQAIAPGPDGMPVAVLPPAPAPVIVNVPGQGPVVTALPVHVTPPTSPLLWLGLGVAAVLMMKGRA